MAADTLHHSRSRPKMIFGYCRVSHDDSVRSDLSIPSQVAHFEAYLEYRAKFNPFPDGVIRGAGGWEGGWSQKAKDGKRIRTRVGRARADGIFVDSAVSAYRRPLRTRPAGSYLDRTLQRGDYIIFPRLDRAFRNLRDFANTMPDWDDRGITIIFLSPNFDMSEAAGRLCGQLFAAFAEFESSQKSERTRDALMQAWHNGRPINHKTPRIFGWRRRDDNQHFIPYWGERQILKEVVVEGAARNVPWKLIRDEMERRMAILERRPVRPESKGCPHPRRKGLVVSEYTIQNLKAWYERYKKRPISLLLSESECDDE